MQDQLIATPVTHMQVPWNRGKLTGAKPPLRPKHVWSIRTKLQIEGRVRDLAMFNLAIDSKLRGCDVVAVRVEDVAAGGYTTDRATVRQKKTGRPGRFELSEQTRQAIDEYLKTANKRPGEFLFTGRRGTDRTMTTRQYARLVSEWIGSVGLDPRLFGTHSLRRAILGVAPGWQKDEFLVMGRDYDRRIGRYTEAVDLIKRLYTEEAVTFEGKHFRTFKLTLAMRPTRIPRPPLWLGGSVDNAVRRAAKIADPVLGDTWVASSHLKNHVIAEQAAVFKAALAEQGKPAPTDFPVLRNIVLAQDRPTAIRDVGPAIAESYRIFGNWGLFTGVVGDAKTHPDFEELIADRFIIGSPEECAAQITDLMQATGCNRLVTRIQWVGMEQRYVMRTIELLGDKVAPLVRKALA